MTGSRKNGLLDRLGVDRGLPTGALDDGPVKGRLHLASVGRDVVHDATGACRFPENGDLGWVTTEEMDLAFHPGLC